MTDLEILAEHRSFGGVQGFYRHASTTCAVPMRFAVYAPPQSREMRVPVLYYLSGLTCTEENFVIKAGAQRLASELGLMLIVPDTSPRNTGIPGEADTQDLGAGAGFYLDATQAPWSAHYHMYSYVTRELPALVHKHFSADLERESIFGHSMGGHGALTIALRNPRRYRSVSAFAPIAAPTRVRWAEHLLPTYLGPDTESWKQYDTCALLAGGARLPGTILVDQGDKDPFMAASLRPDFLIDACARADQPLELRVQAGFDHSYFFVASFIDDHLRHHAHALQA